MIVLLVDDEPCILEILEEFVRQAQPDVLVLKAGSAKEAHTILNSQKIDLVVTDLHGCEGPNLCCEAMSKGVRVVVCTGDARAEDSYKEVLMKPFSREDIERMLG